MTTRIPLEHRAEVARLPAALRDLLEDELVAGNEIVAVTSTFPAPPAGVAVWLARPVRTRPRTSDASIAFYDRNTSSYSGEWHDAQRFFFVLEPPRPPEPEVDMDAVRAQLVQHSDSSGERDAAQPSLPQAPMPDAAAPTRDTPLGRFIESMRIDYERWKEGIGYDLAAIDDALPDERARIEALLVPRATEGWREVEALSRLGTPRAIDALRTALRDGNAEVRAAVQHHAPALVDDEAHTASLVRGLREATFYEGFTAMLDDAATFHPPVVIDTLFREALHGAGDKAVHLAALLFHIHGLTPHRFDWEHRPFFLRFNTADLAARSVAFTELCAAVGVDPATYR